MSTWLNPRDYHASLSLCNSETVVLHGKMSSTGTAFLVFILGLSGAVARFPMSAEGRVRDLLLNQGNYSARERPVLNSDDTVDVELEVSPYAMLDLNEKEEVITTASWCIMTWKDERLTWDPADVNGVDFVTMYTDEIWTPKILISNAVKSDSVGLLSKNAGSILLTADGTVNLGVPLILSTQCPISIRYFPFDSQVCYFSLTPENQFKNQVNFSVRENVLAPNIKSSEWELIDYFVTNFDFPVENYLQNQQLLHGTMGNFCFHIRRDPSYYMITLVAPATLLCILSFVSFLAPTDSGERVSLGVSMVLGLTVFQLLVLDTLPTSSKDLPILGIFIQVNFFISCLTVPFSVGNINIACGDKKLASMKYAWFRRLVLEIMPRILKIPSYKERIEKVTSPQLSLNGERTDGMSTSTSEEALTLGKVEPTPNILSLQQEKLPASEKVKLEARTVALVCDRLAFLFFLLAYITLTVFAVVAFIQNPGPTESEECPYREHGTNIPTLE